jgi:protocatechuate 3,4-dioxygenase alpha subunit
MYVTVFARGLVKHQFTAVFLEDDAGLASRPS